MPTPSGKATAIPAMETEALSRMFDTLKTTAPRTTQPMLDQLAWEISARKGRPSAPMLPAVKASTREKSTIPMT